MKIKSSLAAVALCSILCAGEWNYTDKGPDSWGELNAEWKLCAIGKEQSPININSKDTKEHSHKLGFMYEADAKNIENNGHTLQVNFDDKSKIDFDGKAYKLVQMHFHTPSEYQIDSKEFELEIHMVHKNDKGELLVVSSLANSGDVLKGAESIIQKAPKKKGDKKDLKNFNANVFLPENKAFFTFTGSLTTPPCSEGVRWIVFKNPISLSSKQIGTLHNIMDHNNRKLQEKNKRVIHSAN